MNILKEKTRSLCPVCLKDITASVYEEGGMVYMNKTCLEHGNFTFLIEKDVYLYNKIMNKEVLPDRVAFENLMIAVTHACNLDCPVCYLPGKDKPDLPLSEIKRIISEFKGQLIRISGGEPTVRDDLPEIISFIKEQGKMSALVTNGLKLADYSYVQKLKSSGLNIVSLSLNGLSDEVYNKINGVPALKSKVAALKNLIKENIKVTLSVMLVKGVNEGELRKIYDFYVKNIRHFHLLRIRTAVFSGRYAPDQEQIYLSDMVSLVSKMLDIDQKDLIDLAISSGQGKHLPCQLNIRLSKILLKKVGGIGREKNPYVWLKFLVALLREIGLINMLFAGVKFLMGKDPFWNMQLYLRVWPDKYRIDLEELKRCPSSHFVGETKEIVPFCLGITLNDGVFYL